jgi:hypothetical protein
MMLRRSTIFVLAAAVLVPAFFLTACTDNFTDINTNPNEPTAVTEGPLFTRSLRKAMLDDFTWQVGEHLHPNMFVQHFANSTPGFNTDRYEVNDAWLSRYWDIAYTGFGKDVQQVIDQAEGDPEKVNKLAQARIWKVFVVHRITDFFGDVPYSEAFTGNSTPVYDAQEDIYRDLFSELDAAVQQFDASAQDRFGAADVLYQDDLEAWKRFANSLRLRLAMRVANVAPNLAAEQAQEAVSADGGLISSNQQAATLDPDGTTRTERNPLATVMSFQDSRVSQTLEQTLRSLDDPRLKVYVDTALGASFSERRGFPNGLSASQIQERDVGRFSIAGKVFQEPSNPISVMSHAEVRFLQAEAAVRGFISGDAGVQYEQGIRAVMNRYGVASDSVDIYLAQDEVAWDPADPQDEKIRKIILQKWIALFGRSGFEAWAEYRRTGYPDLQDIGDPDGGSTDGVVPRRVPYPEQEDAVNTENHEAAVARLDQGDTYLSRPWWDVD